ncbi:hypothetical protein [Tenacibaculum agarivorans]|uniref:hypothetical protein n=1 Tax=Tenacibaculum agarivorans TaxID=1908389 RepID=UPI00094BA02A|nr:hypothetical protein [Tenacibaculum agarivorans]
MNIAAVSLAIFIIVLPAILARRIYFTKELSKSFTDKNTLQEIFSSLFLAGFIHSFWITIVENRGYKIDFDIILKLLFNARAIDSYDSISENIYSIIKYFSSITVISVIFSYLLRNIIRYFKIDRKTNLFRYDNNWYYLFSGEVLDITEYNSDDTISSNDINQRLVDVLTKSNSEEIIYRGTLVDYQLDKNNSVEYIVLSYPRKKVNGVNKTITSNYFVIPYDEILNINLKYISTESESSENTENDNPQTIEDTENLTENDNSQTIEDTETL